MPAFRWYMRGCAAVLLPAIAGFADAAAPVTPPGVTASERRELVQRLRALLGEEYVDPGAAARLSTALQGKELTGACHALRQGQALADCLTDGLRAVVHDKHLWIGFRPDGARDEPADGPAHTELDQWRAAIARDNFGFDRVQRLPGNIGYLSFRVFAYPYLAAETASAAMTFIAHSDALIIDLRNNMGGDPQMVALLASYLFDGPVRLNDIRYRKDDRVQSSWTSAQVPGARFGGSKPVFVLTSPATFSAAEDFAYALQARGRATLVGARTGGGARPAREFRIGARFTASIPYAESRSPLTGTNWEGIGVKPDVEVDPLQGPKVAVRLALQTLIERGDTPDRIATWKQLLAEPPEP